MTARITASAVQNCTHAALVALIERIGTGAAAAETGSDASTLRRHRAAGGGWSDVEITALIAYELQEHGHSGILDAIVGLAHQQGAQARGEALRVRTDLIRELDDDAQVDRTILKNLDRTTSAGRREVRDAIALRRQHEDELLADLDAQDRTNGGQS